MQYRYTPKYNSKLQIENLILAVKNKAITITLINLCWIRKQLNQNIKTQIHTFNNILITFDRFRKFTFPSSGQYKKK